MKINKSALILIAALSIAACSGNAGISGRIEGAAEKDIVLKQLEVNKFSVLDTVKTAGDGSFSYKVKVKKGEPEFIYLFYGDTRIAALLLEKGEQAKVVTDTLGNCRVEGSEGSVKLAEVDKEYIDFIKNMDSVISDGPAMAKTYLQHYRNSVKYVISNPFSLTVIPVLYEQLGPDTPVFNQPSDALIFRSAADSLKKVYPESRYVKALEKEAARRMKLMELDGQLRNATEISYPDIKLPDINGEQKSLSSIDSKVIMVHFWDASDVAQKMLNLDSLLPLYNKYHERGFEIYSICVTADKALWGSVVSSQKLPWINVNDGLGCASPVNLYNVTSLPNSFLIVDGDLYSESVSGEDGLRKVLDKVLK